MSSLREHVACKPELTSVSSMRACSLLIRVDQCELISEHVACKPELTSVISLREHVAC